MIFRLFLLFLFVSCFNVPVKAIKDSVKVSSDSTRINYFFDHSFNNNEAPYPVTDTSLTGIQQYNPVYKKFHYHLGNLGLAHHSFFFTPKTSLGFDYGMHNFDLYQFNSKQIKYFNTRKPYTELNLVLGSKKEQYFRLIHAQNISQNWNFGFNVDRIRSEGFYQKQATNTTGLVLHTNYLSKTKKYGILANGVFNKLILQENGGIQQDFYLESFDRVSSIPVNLQSAQNIRQGKSFFIKQYYNLGIQDSILGKNDSLYIKNYLIKGGFSHSVSYEDKAFLYQDNNPQGGMYTNILIDSSKTLDSTNYAIIENEISWSNYNQPVLYSVSAKHQLIKTSQINRDSIYTDAAFDNIILSTEIKNGNKLNYWNVNANYILSGINSGDYLLKGSFNKFFPQNMGSMAVEGVLQKRSPDFILKNYYSNHFEWNYDFSKTGIFSGKLEYEISKIALKTGASLSEITNYIYFDAYARPKQLPEQLEVFAGWVHKDFKIKNWHINNILIYQKTSGTNVIRVPGIISKNSLFYGNNLFKKALYMQIGIDVLYFSDYLANSYMPATSQFYLQNEKKTGNYPYVDFFINLQIKRARIFFKSDHINAGLSGGNYYMVPHYPMPGRALKFGVSWMFYD